MTDQENEIRDTIREDVPVYPAVKVFRNGGGMGMSTQLRKEHEGKYYLQYFFKWGVAININDQERFLQQFYMEVYMAIMFGKVDTGLVLLPGDEPVSRLDPDQTPEKERLFQSRESKPKKISDKNELYYTPSIEEFHVGFGFEAFHHNDWYFGEGGECWVKKQWNAYDDWSHFGLANLEGAIQNGWIRVKYFDKGDIENEGWTIDEEFKDGRLSFTGVFNNAGREDVVFGILYILSSKWILTFDSDDKTVFRGFCKNKSQFKQILIWADVRKSK